MWYCTCCHWCLQETCLWQFRLLFQSLSTRTIFNEPAIRLLSCLLVVYDLSRQGVCWWFLDGWWSRLSSELTSIFTFLQCSLSFPNNFTTARRALIWRHATCRPWTTLRPGALAPTVPLAPSSQFLSLLWQHYLNSISIICLCIMANIEERLIYSSYNRTTRSREII